MTFKKKFEQFLWLHHDGRVSHSKFWSNVGYAVMCFTFPYSVIHGTTAEYMLWFLFGLVVIGNRTLKYMVANNKGDLK